jgi:hypothetical protein
MESKKPKRAISIMYLNILFEIAGGNEYFLLLISDLLFIII